VRRKSFFIGSIVAVVAGCGLSQSSSETGREPDDGGLSVAQSAEGGVGEKDSSSGSTGSAGAGGVDAGGNPSDSGGTTEDGGSGNGSGNSADAAPPVNLDSGTTFVVAQPVSGTPIPTSVPLQGPGLVLMGGGTDVDAAFVWIHDTLAGSSTKTLGNVIVFNTQSAPPSVDNAYTSYIFGLAPFQSVQTLYLGGYKNDGNSATPATAADVAIAAYYVSRADAVFFAGGDQADYVYWNKTSPALMAALTSLYNRGGVIGGTSAGCSILGPYVFDDLAADDQGADPATADVIENPYESSISFTRNMLAFTSLPHVFTDPHFVTRDRFGRLAGFLARQYADDAAPQGAVGVGVDESNALLVDKNGLAHLVQQASGTEAATGTGAYIIQPAGPATTCASGKALLYSSVKVTRLSKPQTPSAAGDSFDFSKGCGSGVQFTVTVNGGDSSNPYSVSPYQATGTATACP
jgi:cyanophycinase-like exopeptidase